MADLFDKGTVALIHELIKFPIKLGVVKGAAAFGAEVLPEQAFFSYQECGDILGIGVDVHREGCGWQFLQGPQQGLHFQAGGRGLGETSGPYPALQPGAGRWQAV